MTLAPEPEGPKIVGILNVTEDSFSDGGRHLAPAAALDRARELLAEGAYVIDVGAASSHPDAKAVDAAEERRRLDPIIDELRRRGATVSVDTFSPETQRHCLARDVDMINDVDGFADPELHRELAASDCLLVVVHSIQGRGKADRRATTAAAVWNDVLAFFTERLATLERAGIARERLILDPGMGFFLGSSPEPSLLVLARLRELRAHFGLPLMVSVSRKSFLGALTGRAVEARSAATLAAELWAAEQGVDYVRTHAVAALRDALTVRAAIEAQR
jgi:dihydropteroate synthase type 2